MTEGIFGELGSLPQAPPYWHRSIRRILPGKLIFPDVFQTQWWNLSMEDWDEIPCCILSLTGRPLTDFPRGLYVLTTVLFSHRHLMPIELLKDIYTLIESAIQLSQERPPPVWGLLTTVSRELAQLPVPKAPADNLNNNIYLDPHSYPAGFLEVGTGSRDTRMLAYSIRPHVGKLLSASSQPQSW